MVLSFIVTPSEIALDLNKTSCLQQGYADVSCGKSKNVSRIRCSRDIKSRSSKAIKNTTQMTRATCIEDCSQFQIQIAINLDCISGRYFIRKKMQCLLHSQRSYLD